MPLIRRCSPHSVNAPRAETEAVGERLAASLHAGDIVLLHGDLGTGKTAFVRGIARGLGASPEEVSSPTFTLVQEYAGGRATLYHADLYRQEPAEVDDLGLDELVLDGIVAVEWAERWPGRPGPAIEVQLEHAGDEARCIRVTRTGNAERRRTDPWAP